ncbi:MAG: hypothetical protein P4M06_09740 [Pandoraea sp.]|nr:hypothetical protein [Pandoraea sp.]
MSAARAPFQHLGDAVGDAYRLLAGEDVDPKFRHQIRAGAAVVDLATGLIPEVQLLRLPGELAEVAADSLEGKKPDAEKVTGIVQYGDPRLFGPHFASRFGRPASGETQGISLPEQPTAPDGFPQLASSPEIMEAPHGKAEDPAHFYLEAPGAPPQDPALVTSRTSRTRQNT